MWVAALLGIYATLGLIFAVPFVFRGAQRIDHELPEIRVVRELHQQHRCDGRFRFAELRDAQVGKSAGREISHASAPGLIYSIANRPVYPHLTGAKRRPIKLISSIAGPNALAIARVGRAEAAGGPKSRHEGTARMQLTAFRVFKYRNIGDSGLVTLADRLTCIVGKNQSGKTNFLKALQKFNPHDKAVKYDVRTDWPRGQAHHR